MTEKQGHRRSEGDRMTDFNFLRIKWPKLAAIAADAGRLVEVSPSSAISTMQNFCEWATDIALDFYDINTQNGITQQEKLETLKAAGHVPGDILTRFHNITLAGGRRLYKANEDVEEARECIADVYEIGRWLNKEADKTGWPPKNDYYRPVMSSMGLPDDGGGFSSGRIGKLFNAYKPLILFGGGILAVVLLLVLIVPKLVATSAKPTVIITPSPSISATFQLATMDNTVPTTAPEKSDFLDSMTPTVTHTESFFLKKWKTASFAIGDKVYPNGIGMFIPSKSITKTQGSWSMKFNLGGTYSKLRFDLGVDAGKQYGAGYGKYRIQIYCDSTTDDPAYDSKMNDYKYTDLGREVDISGCKTLIIKLTEIKGTKGTINVVLGGIRAVKGGEASPDDTSSDSASGSPSPSPSTSASTSASSSASASASASAEASASPEATDEGVQENDP
jgi:hypothetical protein